MYLVHCDANNFLFVLLSAFNLLKQFSKICQMYSQDSTKNSKRYLELNSIVGVRQPLAEAYTPITTS